MQFSGNCVKVETEGSVAWVTIDNPPANVITNELFGTPNPEEKFVAFRRENREVIEEEMGGLAENLPHLRNAIARMRGARLKKDATPWLRHEDICAASSGAKCGYGGFRSCTFPMTRALPKGRGLPALLTMR